MLGSTNPNTMFNCLALKTPCVVSMSINVVIKTRTSGKIRLYISTPKLKYKCVFYSHLDYLSQSSLTLLPSASLTGYKQQCSWYCFLCVSSLQNIVLETPSAAGPTTKVILHTPLGISICLRLSHSDRNRVGCTP